MQLKKTATAQATRLDRIGSLITYTVRDVLCVGRLQIELFESLIRAFEKHLCSI